MGNLDYEKLVEIYKKAATEKMNELQGSGESFKDDIDIAIEAGLVKVVGFVSNVKVRYRCGTTSSAFQAITMILGGGNSALIYRKDGFADKAGFDLIVDEIEQK